MVRRVLPYAAFAALVTALSGCSNFETKPQRPAWRSQAENACIAQKLVRASAYIQPAKEIEGPGICGMTRPFKVTALQGGQVTFNSTATLDCQMTAALDQWLTDVVQPIAQARFGQPIAQINSMGSYSCRGMNNQRGARLSEHSFGNALDIGGFVLADGREITIVRDWTRGDPQTQAFLREVHAGACQNFTTVLSPGSNAFHYNHIHVDLAMHGNTSTGPRRVCKPLPRPTGTPEPRKDDLPDAAPFEDELDIAQASPLSMQQANRMVGMSRGLSAQVPPTPVASVAPSRRPSATAYAAPMNLRPPAPVTGGSMRSDGAFVPEGDLSDFDATSKIRSRR